MYCNRLEKTRKGESRLKKRHILRRYMEGGHEQSLVTSAISLPII